MEEMDKSEELSASEFTLEDIPNVDEHFDASFESSSSEMATFTQNSKHALGFPEKLSTPDTETPHKPGVGESHNTEQSQAGSVSTPSGSTEKKSTPLSTHNTITPDQRRRGRGLSFLPIRPSPHSATTSPTATTDYIQRSLYGGSPGTPHSSIVSPPVSSAHRSAHTHRRMSFQASPQSSYANTSHPNLLGQSGSSPPATERKHRYTQSSISTNSNYSASSNSSSNCSFKGDTFSENDKLQECMTELASKESRVHQLKIKLAQVHHELDAAHADLQDYRRKIEEYAQQFNKFPNPDVRDEHSDVLGISKKVVDGISSQIMSFLGDVRSATMGIPEINPDLEQSPMQSRPQESRGRPSNKKPLNMPDEQEPSPVSALRRLSPKKSIQDMLRRSPSPISSARRQQLQQEKAEQLASQRMREQQRLTKKLSQLDLRSPSSIRN